jgi:hypothetical protein
MLAEEVKGFVSPCGSLMQTNLTQIDVIDFKKKMKMRSTDEEIFQQGNGSRNFSS